VRQTGTLISANAAGGQWLAAPCAGKITMQLANAAFFWGRNKDRFPNFEALNIAPTMGLLMLLTACCLTLFLIAHQERWRRMWLSLGDPRSVALFRIVFGLMTMFNVNGLYENWTYLFTEDGLFTTEVAQQVRARAQFAGYGDGSTPGEAVGFFSFGAFLEWLKGPNYSILLFDSSQTAFTIHIIAFELFMLAFIVGWQTKWTKWVAWFLFHSIIMRNAVYWEGTEGVFRSFFFYLCLSRCGQAYSVDNWLRCRRLRRAGKLSEVGGPGGGAGVPAGPDGDGALAPVYRAIPMWPRYLMMIQTSIVYGYAGPTKNGPTWDAGDGFYYAANLDHFYRLPPQELSAIFGTNVFRLNSHLAHYWQMFFPLVLVGLVLRAIKRQRMGPLETWRRGLGRASMLGMAAGFLAMTLVAYPVHYTPKKGGMAIGDVQLLVGTLVPAGLLALTLIARKIWNNPWSFTLAGQPVQLDMEWVGRWIMGRRIWLGLGFIFHVHLIMLLNVGWFNPGLVSSYIVFFSGAELAAITKEFRQSVARLRRRPEAEIEAIALDFAPPQDPRLGEHRDTHVRLGFVPLLTCLALLVAGALRHAHTLPDLWKAMAGIVNKGSSHPLSAELIAQGGHVHAGWFFICMAVVLVTITLRRRMGFGFDARFAPLLLIVPLGWSYLVEAQLMHMRWSVPLTLALCLLATLKTLSPEKIEQQKAGRKGWETPPGGFAYGPLGRLLAGGVVAYHLAGLSAWVLPQKYSLETFRIEAREPFKWWIRTTHTTQSWSMFAPNPPKSNLFLKVLVHADGEAWDVNTDVYACFDEDSTPEICDAVFPMPWLSYTRQRKINRRVAGSEGGGGAWYQKWHARWYCREWAREHGGAAPDRVDLIKVTYRIPKPEDVAKNGAYDPRTRYLEAHQEKKIYTAHCKHTPFGRLDNEQRAQIGLGPDTEPSARGWVKNRCRGWNKKLANKARALGKDPEAAQIDCIDQQANELGLASQRKFEPAKNTRIGKPKG
jgi:hypothetical protein